MKSDMKFTLALFATLALSQSAEPVTEPVWVQRLAFWARGEVKALTQRIETIDQTLAQLPDQTPINSSIRIGLKTGYTTDEDVRWLELTLKESAPVDSIILVPPLAKAATAVVAGYGFPVRFLLEVFDDQDQSEIILNHTSEDFPNPGCYPVITRFAPKQIKRVRLTATEPWSSDGPEVLAMAEVMILSGKQNLAIRSKVTSSSTRNAPRAWTRSNLVDMATPLGLPIAPKAHGTLGFHSAVAQKADEVKWLTLALPETVVLDELRLVPVRRPEVPLWFDYGFPTLFKVEVATQSDFSDATLLHQVTDPFNPLPGMNLVCIPGQGLSARYIRITATQLWQRRGDYVFALAEVQALSGQENVALRGSFTASDVLSDDPAWSLAALNDGLTEAGRLIDLADWFQQLEQRQTLEKERAGLIQTREHLVERAQHTLVNASLGSVGGISLISVILLWRQQQDRRRDAKRLQEKLARDLHDEIGSNLGSIRLICSFATQPDATLDGLRSDLADIERVAEESADSMRDMVQLINPQTTTEHRDWLDVLHNLSERLLRGHTLDCLLPTSPLTVEPDIETRRELYLFCKEVLHNISRHAKATRVRFHLSPSHEGLSLEIADNGVGFDLRRSSHGHGLSNLHGRAAVMNAKLEIHSQPGEGTSIHLDVPQTKRWRAR